MFKPHVQDATATAVIKGLAVTKYNHAAQIWEVVFLRNCGHHLKLTIREVDRQSGRINVLRTQKIESDNSISITVSASAGNLPWRYVTDGPFNRNPKHDAQDFRWMLDIQQLHGGEVARKSEIETNSLTITDGCFYTSVRTTRPHRKRWIDRQGNASPPETIGLTGSMFGADFKGSAVTIEVAGSGDFRDSLSHKDNLRYEIIFDNTCALEDHPPARGTDFHFYYHLFDDSNGRADILPPENFENTASGSASGESSLDLENGEDPEPEPKEPACHSIDDGDTGMGDS